MRVIIAMRQEIRESRGFTLIEVMTAASIMGFVILGVLGMFAFSDKTSSNSRRLTAATSLAQAQIETARNKDYDNLPDLAVTECFDRDLAASSCGDSRHIYTRITTVTRNPVDGSGSAVVGLTRIEVEVNWADQRDRDLGITHKTYMISNLSRS